MNKVMVFSGIATLLQAGGQVIFSSLGIAQYFCVIDFLRGLPLLIYLKIIYFHNPSTCDTRINIGESIDGIADQAFVLISQETFTSFRTLIINSISLGLSVLWIMSSMIIMVGGAKNKPSKCMRWPWIVTTVAICALDLVATVTYANDSFHTRTLAETMDFIGATVSGIGNVVLDTSWTAWIMVILYSRFVFLFALNIFLIIIVIVVNKNDKKNREPDIANLESPTLAPVVTPAPIPVQVSMATQATPPPVLMSTATQATPAPEQVSTATQATPPPAPTPPLPVTSDDTSNRDEELGSLPSESRIVTLIPRAGLSKSFRKMKAFLFRKTPSPEARQKSNHESVQASPERSPRAQHVDSDLDKKRAVNFPETLLSLPQRLENIIAEQQRRLDQAVIDTSGRASPPRASQSMPHLSTSNQQDAQGRRGTTAGLQGQLPWAYIPASSHRMRDQLPPDEDLPPVPLPDYTAIHSVRKASVHRAASSLSSLTQKKDYVTSTRAGRSVLNQVLDQPDVLY